MPKIVADYKYPILEQLATGKIIKTEALAKVIFLCMTFDALDN